MQPSVEKPRKTRWKRGLAYVGVVLIAVVSVLVFMGWRAFGTSAAGPRLERMKASAAWGGDGFDNPLPLSDDAWGSITAAIGGGSAYASPSQPLPVVATDPELFSLPPTSGVRITWLGHSTTIIEIDGHRILTDPVWGERTSPFSFVGPTRWYPPPIDLEALPSFDAVLISHDHYDHLDAPTIERMRDWDTKFITPLGVGAHLAYWGVPEARIVEVDWWDEVEVGELTIHGTPARHASGRHLFDRNHTLWGSFAIVGPAHRVFFSGDTGMFAELQDIGDRLGPFDVTMIEVGAYHRSWPDWHLGPEQAVQAHQMLRGKVLLPIHWGLFNLALHGWTEPIARTSRAAEAANVALLLPRPGESLEPATANTEKWWPDIPIETAEQHPIRATGVTMSGVSP